MTSNELVIRPSGEVVTRTGESPCPKFDRAVYSALINVYATAIDRRVPPLERDAARTVYEGQLRRLCEDVETGHWDERIPEPVNVPEEWPLPVEPTKSILELIDDPEAFDRLWDQMSWAQKTTWAEERVPKR
jgi:hypothetical protein